jgi:squalene-hopene/tetraprenyl-beta-curcumene cyclase
MDCRLTSEPAVRNRCHRGPGDLRALLKLGAVAICWVVMAGAAQTGEPSDSRAELHRKIVEKGIQYLASNGQAEDGSFSSFAGTGPTSLAVTALLRNGLSPQDPIVAKGLAYLESCAQANGGIYGMKGMFGNYETCAAMMCFQEANRDGKYEAILARAEKYVRGLQWDESRDRESSDAYYGGAGYGGDSRPDLSNTAFLVDAIKARGADGGDEAIQKALAFVSRCQNLESEHNTTPFAAKINDGGFYYTCVPSVQDKERMTAAGGLRSYGSMTYAGLKSMIYAGLTRDDPRVKAAITWIRKHYDLTSNPGMGSAGLYYYYHTFAKSLEALGEELFEDAGGVKHDWRRELIAELARRQQENGSWINAESSRWMEGDPNLVTSFALLALSHCRPKTE